jgi:hypothetical protein
MMSARRLSVRNEPQLEQRAEYSRLQYALAMAYNGVFLDVAVLLGGVLTQADYALVAPGPEILAAAQLDR